MSYRSAMKAEEQAYAATPMRLLDGIGYILQLWRRHWPQALLLLLTLLIYESYKTFFSLTLRSLIDSLQGQGYVQNLAVVLGGLLLAFGLAFGARLVGEWLIARVGAKILNYLRLRMFQQLQRLPQRYYARTPVGEIISRFSGDLTAIERGTTTQFRDALLDVIELCLNIPVLFLLDWRLTLLVLFFMSLLALVLRSLALQATTAGYALRATDAQIATEINENVRGQALIRAFGFEPLMLVRFEHQLAHIETAGFQAAFARAMVSFTAKAILALGRLVTCVVGVWLVMRGGMSIGDLVAFLGLAEIVNLAVDDFCRNVLPDLINATNGIQRLEDLLQQPPDTIEPANAVVLAPLARQIQLQDASFSYTGQQANLHNIRMTILAGQSVAFVGPSGSGKSTLLGLLMRAHRATTGTITIDGTEIGNSTRASLQQQMGVVFQETYLFDITIGENIRMAKPAATDAEVVQAAKLAEIHDMIMALPQGYDTHVGEAGGALSGGQRQRIAIARAILRDPAILILDEATSALDPGTEAAINATLHRLGVGRTVISVTHRLASVVDADTIFVLDGGKVVESGTHDLLLQQQGLYAQLWQKQTGFAVRADGRAATVHAAYLGQMTLFAELDSAMLNRLAERFSPEYVVAGQVLFRQGDPGDKLYLIARGQVEVIVATAQGADRTIDRMSDGDHFGEMALLQDVARNATIRTITDCLFLTLPKNAFLALLDELPQLRPAIARQIQRTLRNRTHQQVTELAATNEQPMNARLAFVE